MSQIHKHEWNPSRYTFIIATAIFKATKGCIKSMSNHYERFHKLSDGSKSTIPFKHVPTPFVKHKCLKEHFVKHKCLEESIVKLALTHISFKFVWVCIWLDCYCAWATLDPCQPKIPVSPVFQSAQDPSQPWMYMDFTHAYVFGSCSYCIWLILLLYLAHALIVFDLFFYCTWLMLLMYLALALP
jgi:hypothetical protein